jgi:hypothetical protein
VSVHIHPHARERLRERGASEAEVVATVTQGGSFRAKLGRMGFRRNFAFGAKWRGKYYANKQVIAYAVRERRGWMVITIITKFF